MYVNLGSAIAVFLLILIALDTRTFQNHIRPWIMEIYQGGYDGKAVVWVIGGVIAIFALSAWISTF